ncbi:MAG: helix-turn-helix domain-containing protein [Acidimicrobiia bacterium]|nr:helix-turn-helix domain-containing protein [Acidimicrobiia bacterium]
MTDDLWDRQNKALGAFIRAQRELASLSLRQLSDMTDVSNAYLSQIERGLHEPSVRVIRSVARALGVPAEVLLAQAGLIDDAATEAEARADAGGAGTQAPPPSPSSVEDAVRADPRLSDAEKEALLAVYRSYVAGK